MKLPSIPYLAEAFTVVLRRFPLVMAAATAAVAAIIYTIENDSSTDKNDIANFIMSCSLGAVTLLGAKLIVEKWRLQGPISFVPHLVAVALLVTYYLTLDHDNTPAEPTMVRFMGLSLAAHLLVAFLPYLDDSPVEDFWEYNKRLFGNFTVGAFYSFVIFAGLSIAILAVNELFNLNIDGKIYAHLFTIIAGIFNTAYFLAHFPMRFDFGAEATENQEIAAVGSPYTSSFKNLTKFILIPIVGIYFLILYAFSAKILVTWELPEGWVGKLVLGFSVAGIFTYLLNYLLVKFDDSEVVKGFRRWFFYILLPMVLLLFVSIGRRISDYGVTESRYVVATAGIWLLLSSVYFVVSRRDNIKFIPISLAAFSLLTVLGPFSAFKASERSQVGRLKTVLEKNGMFKDGLVVAATDTISRQDSEQAIDIISYLRNSEKLEAIKPWFGVAKDSLEDWQASFNLLDSLGISPNNTGEASKHCSINFNILTNAKGINISGFDILFPLSANSENAHDSNFTGFYISQNKTGLDYIENGEVVFGTDLLPYLQKLDASGFCRNSIQADSLGFFDADIQGYKIRIMPETLSFEKGEKWELEGIYGNVLLRKEQ